MSITGPVEYDEYDDDNVPPPPMLLLLLIPLLVAAAADDDDDDDIALLLMFDEFILPLFLPPDSSGSICAKKASLDRDKLVSRCFKDSFLGDNLESFKDKEEKEEKDALLFPSLISPPP